MKQPLNFGEAAGVSYRCPIPSSFLIRDRAGAELGDAHREKEHIIAEFCVDLIEKYNYRLSDIQIREMVPLLFKGEWIYPEVDIAVKGGSGFPSLLIDILSAKEYEDKFDSHAKKLFQIAESVHPISDSGLFLVLYARLLDGKEYKERIASIDFSRFRTFDDWINAGRPFEDHIPFFRS